MENSTSSNYSANVVYSNVVGNPVFSEEDTDFVLPLQEFRLTEPAEPRDLEDENKRLLE